MLNKKQNFVGGKTMFNAIVYSSCTGSSKRYAEMLSAQLHIPAHPLGKEPLRPGSKIIFVGWVFAGKVMGYKKAAKKYDVGAVVSVGMSPVGPKSEDLARKANSLGAGMKVFCRQGGFNINKLPLPFKLIMQVKNKEIAERFEGRSDLSPQEQATYTMASTGVGEPPCWCVDDIVESCK